MNYKDIQNALKPSPDPCATGSIPVRCTIMKAYTSLL
jgi:hypothetical protein